MPTDDPEPATPAAEMMQSAMLPVFSRLLPAPAAEGPGPLRLLLEAALFTALALAVAVALDVPQSGFFAIFLTAAGLTGRLSAVLEDNRDAIYRHKVSPVRANRRTAASLLAIFMGCFLAFATAALWFGEEGMRGQFQFVMETARLGSDTILTRTFAAALPLFIHNALVLAVFVALSFIYRAYGALMVLAWNACTWGLVLAFLVRRGVAVTQVRPVLFVMGSLAAVLPHLVLEAAGYVAGSLAAIFLSRAAGKYSFGHPSLRPVLRAVAVLLGTALACLLVAAIVESIVPHRVLSLLGGAGRGR